MTHNDHKQLKEEIKELLINNAEEPGDVDEIDSFRTYRAAVFMNQIMQLLVKHEESLIERPEYGKPLSTFIQWKGTDLCMDWFCAKGHQNHVDDSFVYYVSCEECGETYKTGDSIYLTTSKEEKI